MTKSAMIAAGPQGRLRGMLFIEGEGTAMPMYNTPLPIFPIWGADFIAMVNGLRSDLATWNPHLPVLLGVQRVLGRDRVFPYISQVGYSVAGWCV